MLSDGSDDEAFLEVWCRRVWDKDIYSADDSVGVVVLDLNCLLMNTSTREIKGWFPIFDTVNGVRGYLHLIAKLQFFGDINPFKDSAAGVHFFSCIHSP